MGSLVVHLVRKTEEEAIYTRERQRANLERFRAYRDDFRGACACRDYRRVSEVVRDVGTISNDSLRLLQQMRGIQSRLTLLRSADAPDAGES